MKHTRWLLFLACIAIAPARGADDIESILTLAGELDDQSSRFLMIGFDRRLAANTWLSIAANHVDLNNEPSDSGSRLVAIGVSHGIGQWDVSLGVDYWEVDGDSLVSTDISSSVYYRFEKWTLGLDLVRRDTELRFVEPATDRRLSDDVTGEGYGVGFSYSPNDDWYLYGSYMEHDFEGRIIKRPAYEVFSRLSFTADDSLLDHYLLLGVDYFWSRYSIGFYTGDYRSAFDSLDTSTYNVFVKALLSESVDMQVSLGLTNPEGAEDSVHGGVSFSVYW